jgi:hypothetical protein
MMVNHARSTVFRARSHLITARKRGHRHIKNVLDLVIRNYRV